VPSSGFIALLNLRSGRLIRPGAKVLVNGAGGGVGALALQIAKAHGAQVTAVDSAAKLNMLRSLGADHVIDYRRENFTQGVARYDLIFDVPGNHPLSSCMRVLAADGTYLLIGHERYDPKGNSLFGLFPRFVALIFRSFFVKRLRLGHDSVPTTQDAIVILRELLEAGKITPVIDSTYPLSEIREAFRHMIEDETCGKVIVTP
jgi:NADPH:quinone reductase-like Zn-dependent oxidoreductase